MIRAGLQLPMDKNGELIIYTMKSLVELGHQSNVPDTLDSQAELQKTIQKMWEGEEEK